MANDNPAEAGSTAEAVDHEQLSDAELGPVSGGTAVPVTRPRRIPSTSSNRYTGPPLTGTGGSEVAIESIDLTSERFEP
jgi:hypothetical protein